MVLSGVWQLSPIWDLFWVEHPNICLVFLQTQPRQQMSHRLWGIQGKAPLPCWWAFGSWCWNHSTWACWLALFLSPHSKTDHPLRWQFWWCLFGQQLMRMMLLLSIPMPKSMPKVRAGGNTFWLTWTLNTSLLNKKRQMKLLLSLLVHKKYTKQNYTADFTDSRQSLCQS